MKRNRKEIAKENFFKKVFLGIPSELYFIFRYFWLFLTIPKKYFDPESTQIDPVAIVYVHGLFGTSYEFIDINNFLKKKYPAFNSYYFSYPHGRAIDIDIQSFENFIQPILKKHEKIIFIGHSRGATICRQTAARLNINFDKLCVILIGEPLNGSYVAEIINNLLKNKIIGKFVNFLIKTVKMEKAIYEFSFETMKENRKLPYLEHHLIGSYDVVSRSVIVDDFSTSAFFFPVSHLGLVISTKVLKTLYLLIKQFVEQD